MTVAPVRVLTFRDKLIAAFAEEADQLGRRLEPEEFARVADETATDLDLHDHSECRCLVEHCEDPDAHLTDLAALHAAVQALHYEAHNTTQDSLYADFCRRESCVAAQVA